MIKNNLKKFIILILLLIVLIIARLSGVHNWFRISFLQSKLEIIQQFVDNHYSLAVLFYSVFFAAAIVLSIPVTVVLTVAAGYFFGIWLGAVYAIASATGGALCSFMVYRYFLYDIIQQRYRSELMRFNSEISRFGVYYLLVLQLLPITPTLLINIFAGLTTISVWSFVWTTAIGVLPGTLIYTFIGQHLTTLTTVQGFISWPLLGALCGLAALAFVPIVIKKGWYTLV
jgi:uncharacterized membrane protein YdjX (TVP38/TMEM64 family)